MKPGGTGKSYDDCRPPAIITVQDYVGGDGAQSNEYTLPWTHYLLFTASCEIRSEFERLDSYEEKTAYLRAFVSSASNFAWWHRAAHGHGSSGDPIPGNTSHQCYAPEEPIPDWWPRSVQDAEDQSQLPLQYRIHDTDEGAEGLSDSDTELAQTFHRAFSDIQECDYPVRTSAGDATIYAFAQRPASYCEDEHQWGWATLIDKYYPEDLNSEGWEIKEIRPPDFHERSKEQVDGGVRIKWNGTGIWHSKVYRCNRNPDQELVCNDVIFDKGFDRDCLCIRHRTTDHNPNSIRIYRIRIFNPKGGNLSHTF
jgi:hypothetical protein